MKRQDWGGGAGGGGALGTEDPIEDKSGMFAEEKGPDCHGTETE